MLLRLCVFTLVFIGSACSVQSQSLFTQESEGLTVNLTSEAIEAAVITEGALWLKLTTSGSSQLAATGKADLGSEVMIRVLGHEALSMMVVHDLAPERLVIKNPSPELKAAINTMSPF